MLQHGVTTVVFGNCSLSLAPVRPDDRVRVAEVFAYIEDMPVEMFSEGMPWTWASYREYQHALLLAAPGLNVGGFVGHTALRQYVMGAEAWKRESTDEERQRIADLLITCLDDGAAGLSTSFFDEDAAKRPVPSRLADEDELSALLSVLGKRHRVLTFIPDVAHHAHIVDDVERVATLCRQFNVTATWNGLFHDERKPERSAEILAQAARLQSGGARVYPQVSPRSLDFRVNWDGGMSFYSLMQWHRVVQAPSGEKRLLLSDLDWRQAAREEWDAKPRTLIRHKELDRIRLISVTRPELATWLGYTLADLVAAKGGHPSDVLADWVLANDLNPGIVSTGVANAEPDGVAALLTHKATVISNSDAGAHVQMMCAAGDTTLLLARHVRERGDMALEAAVQALTARQAELHGLRGRGRIAPGAAADITVFDLAELSWKPDVLVNDLPQGAVRLRRPPGGYRATVVNGMVAQQHGQLTDSRAGVVLGSSDYANDARPGERSFTPR
jgi:N-acyl-D-aspartate/D-glutamate deacylase